MRLVDAEFEEKHYLSMVDNPTPDVTENDKRTALAIARAFQMARTVEERKTGKWIEHKNADIVEGFLVSNYECSKCHSWERNDSTYCPSCGSKNKE